MPGCCGSPDGEERDHWSRVLKLADSAPGLAPVAGRVSGPGPSFLQPPAPKMAGATPPLMRFRTHAALMPTQREKLVEDINGLKERIGLAWIDMMSKPMQTLERRELSKSMGSLLEQLDQLQSRLDQLPSSRT